MMEIKINDIINEPNLYSRTLGEIVKDIIRDIFRNDENVIIDFNYIETISEKFSDGLIGSLIREYGIDYIREHINFTNCNDNVINMLNSVIEINIAMISYLNVVVIDNM